MHASESPSTPLNLSTLSKSVDEIGSASLVLTTDSKQRKERDLVDSSVLLCTYALWFREGSRGGNSGGTLDDADMTKLIEVKEKARVTKHRPKKKVVVQKKRKRERQ